MNEQGIRSQANHTDVVLVTSNQVNLFQDLNMNNKNIENTGTISINSLSVGDLTVANSTTLNGPLTVNNNASITGMEI